MSRKLLTEELIGALQKPPHGQRYIVYDALVRGFGVRITDVGGKSYVLVARFPGRRNPTRRKIGVFGAVSLEEARQIARDMHAEICRMKKVDNRSTDGGSAYNRAAAQAWERRAQEQFILRLENEAKRHCRIRIVRVKEAIFEKASVK